MTREGIARSMAVREAKFAWPTLVRLYRAEASERVKHGIAAALGAISKNDDELFDELMDLLRDRRHGACRGLLLTGLFGSRKPRAHEALLELQSDPDLTKEITHVLNRRERAKRKIH